jgi:hypothetical protein
LTVLLAALALHGSTPSALADERHPTGEFAPLTDCPLSNPATNYCVLTQVDSGEFVFGTKTIPIRSTLTIQGGLHIVQNEELEIEGYEFLGAEDGDTLSKTPLPVPGGLLGIVAPRSLPRSLQETLKGFIDKGITSVTATAELAAPATAIGIDVNNLVGQEGVGLQLPIKVKVSNPFLGENCYIGSNAHPISLTLTDGETDPPKPNKPIDGKFNGLEYKQNFTLTVVKEAVLVNNSFTAPEATGCGGSVSRLVDLAVDEQLGLPAAAGHNTAILNSRITDAGANAVRVSE